MVNKRELPIGPTCLIRTLANTVSKKIPFVFFGHLGRAGPGRAFMPWAPWEAGRTNYVPAVPAPGGSGQAPEMIPEIFLVPEQSR